MASYFPSKLASSVRLSDRSQLSTSQPKKGNTGHHTSTTRSSLPSIFLNTGTARGSSNGVSRSFNQRKKDAGMRGRGREALVERYEEWRSSCVSGSRCEIL